MSCGACGHTGRERYVTGTWITVEFQDTVAICSVIVAIYEAWNYDETTVYDRAISEWDLFAKYMNTLIKIKMEVSVYPIGCTISKRKHFTSNAYVVHTGEYSLCQAMMTSCTMRYGARLQIYV